MTILDIKLPYNKAKIQKNKIIQQHLQNITRVTDILQNHLKVSLELSQPITKISLKSNEYDLYTGKYVPKYGKPVVPRDAPLKKALSC